MPSRAPTRSSSLQGPHCVSTLIVLLGSEVHVSVRELQVDDTARNDDDVFLQANGPYINRRPVDDCRAPGQGAVLGAHTLAANHNGKGSHHITEVPDGRKHEPSGLIQLG